MDYIKSKNMAKKTINEIREETRKRVSKEYTGRIKENQLRIDALYESNKKLREENNSLKHEIERLNDELRIKTDWIERLADYCNMDENERSEALLNLKSQKESNEALETLLKIYSSLFTKFI